MESRTQGLRSRPRTQKKNPRPRPRTAFPRTDTLEAKDRNAGGQGQGPWTQAQVLSKKNNKRSSQKFFRQSQKKKVLTKKIFKRSPQKNVFQKIFQALHKILTIQKIVLSSSRGQANFRRLKASRPRPRTSKCVLEAKDVLEDSTSGCNPPQLGLIRGWVVNVWRSMQELGRKCKNLSFFCFKTLHYR